MIVGEPARLTGPVRLHMNNPYENVAIYPWFNFFFPSFGRPYEICFPKFCCMPFSLISTSLRIIVTVVKEPLVAIRYLFLTMKQLLFETFGRNFDFFWGKPLDSNFEISISSTCLYFFLGRIFLICSFLRSFFYDVHNEQRGGRSTGHQFWSNFTNGCAWLLWRSFSFCAI